MNKLIAVEEALAFARGTAPAARLTVNGHAYVPEAALPPKINQLTDLLRQIIERSNPGERTMDQIIKDLDAANIEARAALAIIIKPRRVK